MAESEMKQTMESVREDDEQDSPRVFVDTNILVYAASLGAPLHHQASKEIQKRYESGQDLWVSRQVLREYLASLSRSQTFSRPKPVQELTSDIRYFLKTFRIAEEGPAVTEKLLELMEGRKVGGKQIHDANIVATMLVHGIPALLTHNGDDFTRFSDMIQVIPLEEERED
jgi:predicted nucleic acid-binding protein